MLQLRAALAKIGKHPPVVIPRDVPMPSTSLRATIAFWDGLPETGTLKQVLLHTLSCLTTEDAETDECRLEIYADGVLQPPVLRRDMRAGIGWAVARSHCFNSEVHVKLWDEDAPDPDDLLGTVTIDGTVQQGAAASFTRDHARYILSYTVRDFPVLGGVVASAIDRFEQSQSPGAWPQLSKDEIVDGVRERVRNPYLVKQDGTPLCGPAAIVFELVSRQPLRYIQLCQELFESGRFTARTRLVEPSTTLLQSKVPDGVAPADWMFLATLRDTENAIFPVDSTSGDVVVGLTMPGEIKGWTSELLCYDTIEYDSTCAWGEFDAIEKAARVRAGGGVSFLLIDASLLKGTEPIVAYPNHWVSFVSGLVITGNSERRIKFQCYSWGGSPRQVDADEETFEDYMWGVVTGES